MGDSRSSYSRVQASVDHANREPNDFYPTWPPATEALLSVESFDYGVWEPAAGMGDMARVLMDRGYRVRASDLIYRRDAPAYIQTLDFLKCRAVDPRYPSIVTNPPFALAREFVEHACRIATGKVAMFMRLAMLEGINRRLWWQRMPLARVWVMSRRVPIQRGRVALPGEGHGAIAFAWFVFEPGRHEGPPTIGWLDWKTLDGGPDDRASHL